MKLTKHQEEIVDKIIEGKVYDITTYLKEFEKAHMKKYDLPEIRKVFENLEKDKRYSFVEKDSYYYTLVYDKEGKVKNTYKNTEPLTYRFKENPLKEPVHAELSDSIQKQLVQFKGEKYIFDFTQEVLVADSFDDIKEFLALWCYLKSEALIFDVNKPVVHEDIGLFFEIKTQEIVEDNNPTWWMKTVIDSVGEAINDAESHNILAPYKNINNYMERVWKVNEENLRACEEFIGKKILTTGALEVYQQKKYRTVEELSVRANLRIARVAVVISVISVVIGNIVPLFQKQDTDYLDEISCKITEIEDRIEKDNSKSDVIDKLNEIQNQLKVLEEKFTEFEKGQSNTEKGLGTYSDHSDYNG